MRAEFDDVRHILWPSLQEFLRLVAMQHFQHFNRSDLLTFFRCINGLVNLAQQRVDSATCFQIEFSVECLAEQVFGEFSLFQQSLRGIGPNCKVLIREVPYPHLDFFMVGCFRRHHP